MNARPRLARRPPVPHPIAPLSPLVAVVAAAALAALIATAAPPSSADDPERAVREPARTDAPAAVDEPIEVVPADASIVPPHVLIETQHAPVFPPAAKAARMSGAVIVQAEIGPDGAVSRVAVLESTHPNLGFEDAAAEAVRGWKFHPAHRIEDGTPVTYVTQFRLTFGEVDGGGDGRPRILSGGVPVASQTPSRNATRDGARDSRRD